MRLISSIIIMPSCDFFYYVNKDKIYSSHRKSLINIDVQHFFLSYTSIIQYFFVLHYKCIPGFKTNKRVTPQGNTGCIQFQIRIVGEAGETILVSRVSERERT